MNLWVHIDEIYNCYGSDCFLGCDAIQSGKKLTLFPKNDLGIRVADTLNMDIEGSSETLVSSYHVIPPTD